MQIRYLWIWCLFLFLASCREEQETLLPPDLALLPGDVVFRQGNGWDSRAVLTADRDGSYTHIGIVVEADGRPMIVHAVPGEPDFPGDVDRVKMDVPEVFFRKDRAAIGELMRVDDRRQAARAAAAALRLYEQHLLFDHDYDDEDSTKMYCTELVVAVYRVAGVDLAVGPRRHITFPIRFSGYFPSAVQRSPDLVSIRRF